MKVVILAGGFGTRISEESHLKPKPMIEIGEKPILWHIMKEYSAYGINEFIICAGYKQHHDRFRPLCEAGINLLLNLLLVNIGGLYGILLSTIISMSFVSLPWLVMNLFNFVFRRSSSEYISILIQNVIVVIVDMIVCYAICQMVHLGGIMTIIFRGAVCVVFSNISYFAIWKNNEDFKDAIKLLNSIFKGKR